MKRTDRALGKLDRLTPYMFSAIAVIVVVLGLTTGQRESCMMMTAQAVGWLVLAEVSRANNRLRSIAADIERRNRVCVYIRNGGER